MRPCVRIASPKPSVLHRHWMLDPKIVFLNHGSFGACPKSVLKAQAEFRKQLEKTPVQFLFRRFEEHLEPAREALAKFVGARPQDLAFTANATTGVNSVVGSLNLRRGDALLTTNLDYNACHNALNEIARRAGAVVQVAQVPFPLRHPDQVLEAILKSVTRRTRLAMIDHVSSHTALILPIERIVRELQGHGIEVLVDGAHAPGMVPLNLTRLAPDYYTGNLHKWVCAPKGAGFLWARENKQSNLHPTVISHGYNTPRAGYSSFQDRFDWTGTFDPTPWLCIKPSIEYMGRLLPGGWKALQDRNRRLVVKARELLCRSLQIEPPCPESMLGSMATLALPEKLQGRPKCGRIDAEQIRLYDEFGIEVPFVRFGHPEWRWFRISAQLYNSLPQYDYLAAALKRFN